MEEYEKNIVPHIEAIYENFTPLEKTIADFFIHNEEKLDLSSIQKAVCFRSISVTVCKEMRI